MGNVQSEATPESETAKDREEKAGPDRSKPDRGPSGAKHELGSRSPGLQAPEQTAAGQPLSGEPGGGGRQAGAVDMGKNHSKKPKLKLSSMWAQNSASGGMKEAGLCGKGPGAGERGLACLSRVDLHSAAPLLSEGPRGLKVAPRPSHGAACDPRALSSKRAPAKGAGNPEGVHLAKGVGGRPLQPEKPADLCRETDVPRDAAETEACCTQHIRARAKDPAGSEGWGPASPPSATKRAASPTPGATDSTTAEDTSLGSQTPDERSASRPALCNCAAPPGAQQDLLLWGADQREREQPGPPDCLPTNDGDPRGPASASQLPAECAGALSIPVERPQALGSDGKTAGRSEGQGAEAVSSETMQELLEKGLNFLYKVTIQPGQWPPSVKAVKQKPSLLSSSISYADVLKQCSQKKPPPSAPGLPKALPHLAAAASKKLPPFKGLERSNPEDFSSLGQLFLEHFKKVTPPTELAHHPTGQPVVTFFEELPSGTPKRPEWQRPRPPTPYPQRQRGQDRKLPAFGSAVSQVVALLGSDVKCDCFLHAKIQMPLNEAAAAAGEGGKDCARPPGAGRRLVRMVREAAEADDESPPSLRRRPQGPEEGAREASPPIRSAACSAARGSPFPVPSTHLLRKQGPPPGPPPGPAPHLPRESLEARGPDVSAPSCAPVGTMVGQKALAMTQARPKARKQGPAGPKSKEKLKHSGQPKMKAPKGKGQKQWPRGYGMPSPRRLEGAPLFPPFEKVARPFYFGEPLEAPLSLDKPAGLDQDAASSQVSPAQDPDDRRSPVRKWPAFQVADSCSRKCYCKHQDQRSLPRNVMAWLNPSANHLVEPPWVATAMLAVSLVAGTKFCLDSYEQQRVGTED